MDSAEKRVLDTLDPQRLTECCATLVKIPTVSPYSGDDHPSGEQAGQQELQRRFTEMGAECVQVLCRDELYDQAGVLAPKGRQVEDRPNLVATFRLGSGDGPTLVLDAHMDTVAVGAYEGDPFSGDVRDGFIHGRGAADDKQGVSIMLEVARALLDSGNTYQGTLVCCSVVDEECDGAGRGSLACIDHIGPMDAAIVLDGAAGGIWNGCTGVLTAAITVKGKAGHAAGGESVNAIEKAVHLFPAFSVFRDKRGNHPGDVNIGVFKAGDHPANVPNTARIAINIKTTMRDMQASQRAYEEFNGRTVRELFETCIAAQAADDPFLRRHPPTVTWVKDVPAALAEGDAAEFVRLAADAHADIHGARADVRLLPGWGDVSHFLNAGCPAFGIGAGFPGAAHSAAEKVCIDDMVNTARTVAAVAHRVLEGGLAQRTVS